MPDGDTLRTQRLASRGGVTMAAVVLAAAITGCSNTGSGGMGAKTSGEAFAGPIEKAHQIERWYDHEAFQTQIEVAFGKNPPMKGTLTFTSNMAKSRMDLANGTVLVFDGEKAWISPASAEMPRARFHLLTWPYFIMAPYKLRDPGSHLEPTGERQFEGTMMPTAKLTFKEGVGDAPDDWYIAYRDPATQRLAGLAYIVTYGDKDPAKAEPHAVRYADFQMVEGVPVPTRWTFYNWSEDKGIHGDPIGKVTLTSPRFIKPSPGMFKKPTDAKEDKLPTN